MSTGPEPVTLRREPRQSLVDVAEKALRSWLATGRHRGEGSARPGPVQQLEQPLEPQHPGEGLGPVADGGVEAPPELPLAQPEGVPQPADPAGQHGMALQQVDGGRHQRVGAGFPRGGEARQQPLLEHRRPVRGRGGHDPLLELAAVPAPDGLQGDPGVAQLAGPRPEHGRAGAGAEADPDHRLAGPAGDRDRAGVRARDQQPPADDHQVHAAVGQDPAGPARARDGQLPDAPHPGRQRRRRRPLAVGDGRRRRWRA